MWTGDTFWGTVLKRSDFLGHLNSKGGRDPWQLGRFGPFRPRTLHPCGSSWASDCRSTRWPQSLKAPLGFSKVGQAEVSTIVLILCLMVFIHGFTVFFFFAGKKSSCFLNSFVICLKGALMISPFFLWFCWSSSPDFGDLFYSWERTLFCCTP